MFSADLSWTDNTTEKVGQRRQRRANKREDSISSSTSGSKKDGKAIHRHGQSSLGSISKTVSFSSVKDSMRRPSTAASTQLKLASVTVLETVEHRANYKDPAYQPEYTLSAKLGSRLPSGAVLESPRVQHTDTTLVLPVPPDFARQEPTNENRTCPPNRKQQHRAWSVNSQVEAENICQSYEQVKDEILALHNPDAILPQPEVISMPRARLAPCSEYDETSPGHAVRAEEPFLGRPTSVEYLNHIEVEKGTSRTKYVMPVPGIRPQLGLPAIFRSNVVEQVHQEQSKTTDFDENFIAKTSRWSAPKDWDIVRSQVEIRKILDSDSSNDDSGDHRRRSIFVGSHFQRFVRRMESAGPRIILERLKEKWALPGDRAMNDELQLEQHLWALTALQLPSMDRFIRAEQHNLPHHPLPPTVSRGRRKILELDGSIGEVYQLSAIYPDSRIYHLTRSPRSSSIPLPSQAIQHEIGTGSPTDSLASMPLSSAAGILPLPYANASMHHIRSTRMPTLVAGSQLPALLSECYRVLKPGGILEFRLMDATPERRSMGPLLANWLEDRLLLSLEAEFRCTRPLMLVPRWARDAGLLPLSADTIRSLDMCDPVVAPDQQGTMQCLRLPAVASVPYSTQRDIPGQVGVLVSRALWKDAWGPYVCDDHENHWWWESPEIVEECREYATAWDVGIMIMMKPFAFSI